MRRPARPGDTTPSPSVSSSRKSSVGDVVVGIASAEEEEEERVPSPDKIAKPDPVAAATTPSSTELDPNVSSVFAERKRSSKTTEEDVAQLLRNIEQLTMQAKQSSLGESTRFSTNKKKRKKVF